MLLGPVVEAGQTGGPSIRSVVSSQGRPVVQLAQAGTLHGTENKKIIISQREQRGAILNILAHSEGQ